MADAFEHLIRVPVKIATTGIENNCHLAGSKKAARQKAQVETQEEMESMEPDVADTLPAAPPEPATTPEQRIRAAKSPEEVAFALIGLVGEGLGLKQIVDAVVDAKIEDASLPDGTNRAQVKKGVATLLGGLGALLK